MLPKIKTGVRSLRLHCGVSRIPFTSNEINHRAENPWGLTNFIINFGPDGSSRAACGTIAAAYEKEAMNGKKEYGIHGNSGKTPSRVGSFRDFRAFPCIPYSFFLLLDFSSFTVFLTLGAIGFLFLLVSFFFGDVLDAGDNHLGSGHDAGHHGPGFFDLRNAGLFLTALGGLGALAQLRGYGAAASAVVGLLGGAGLAGIVFFYARFLFRQQASSLVSNFDLVGRLGEVIISIPEGGAGQVRCLIGESMVEKIARTRDGSALGSGAPILIEEVTGESVIVSRWPASEDARRLPVSNASGEPGDSAERSAKEELG